MKISAEQKATDKLRKKLRMRRQSLNILYFKIVKDINKYLEENPDAKHDLVSGDPHMKSAEHLADDMIEGGAWIYDRLGGKMNQKESMTKKVRKALGCIIP